MKRCVAIPVKTVQDGISDDTNRDINAGKDNTCHQQKVVKLHLIRLGDGRDSRLTN